MLDVVEGEVEFMGAALCAADIAAVEGEHRVLRKVEAGVERGPSLFGTTRAAPGCLETWTRAKA